MKAPSKWILLTELTGGDLWQMFSGPVGGGHGNGKGDNAYEHTFGLAVHFFDEREA
jgi:hypothetical protein